MIRTRRYGFTLIELLVVILIVAILAAILLPIFGRAIESSKERSSVERQRQVIAASLLYAADHNDFVPPYSNSRRDYVREGVTLPSMPEEWKLSLVRYANDEKLFYSPFDSIKSIREPGLYISDTKHTSWETHLVLITESLKAKTGFMRLQTTEPLASDFPYVVDLCWLSSGGVNECIRAERACMAYLDGHSKCEPIPQQE